MSESETMVISPDPGENWIGEGTVHERLLAILSELPAIGKVQENKQQNFMYRGHDDVLNALNPLLAKYGVFMVPQVLERLSSERQTSRGSTMYEVNLHVAYTFFGPKGDSFTASAWGEGTDMGDKSTNKAMTMAFKNVIAQVFAVSTSETIDSDSLSPEETQRGAQRNLPPREISEPFDPKKHLLQDAPLGWQEIADRLEWVSPTIDWGATVASALRSVYATSDRHTLAAEQQGEVGFRLANVAARLSEQMEGDFPPVDDEAIKKAFAEMFEGAVVEVMVKTIVPEEETTASNAALTPEQQQAMKEAGTDTQIGVGDDPPGGMTASDAP